MTDSVALRPPATAPIPHERNSFVPAYDGEPDTEDISFRDLWDDPDKGMTFADFIDIINPLQHIPVISTLYRLVTGDTISQGARMAGDVLFGGAPGLIASGIALAFEEASGDTPEGHIMAMLNDDAPDADAGQRQQAASAAPAAETAPVTATAAPAAAGTTPVAATAAPAVARTAGAARHAPPAPIPHAAATPLFTARRPAASRFVPAAQPAKTMPATPQPSAASRTTDAPPETAADKARASRADRMAAERQRIAETIARARNQQIGLLMANLLPSAASSPNSDDDADSNRSGAGKPASVAAAIAARPGDPFRSHPFMLPPGASPEMVSRAMERALSKYQQGLRARGAAR